MKAFAFRSSCSPFFANSVLRPWVFASNAGALGIALGHVRDAWNFEGQLKNEVGAVECLTALLKGNTAVTSIDLGRNNIGGCLPHKKIRCSRQRGDR